MATGRTDEIRVEKITMRLHFLTILTIVLGLVCFHKLVEKEGIIVQLHNSVVEKERAIAWLQRFLPASSYTCHVSGPGLSATANYPTHVKVELSDASGQPCSLRQNVTAELQSVDLSSVAEVRSADTWRSWWPWSEEKPQTLTTGAERQSTGESSVTPTTVSVKSPSQYEVSYTALSRGQHKLHVRLNGSEVSGSPFNITVYPNPTQLEKPVRIVTGLSYPWDIAINSHGEMVVSNSLSSNVVLLDSGGKEIQTYGSEGDRPDQMMYPTGVAVDSDDNVYVASEHKLQKFSRDGHLINYVGQCGCNHVELEDPQGIRVYHGYVYVCDKTNYRIQIFNSDLNLIATIDSPLWGRGYFDEPYDMDFDFEGKLYIGDGYNNQTQVITTSERVLKPFGQEKGEGKLNRPTSVHVMGQFVYVSDWGHDRIAVYHTSGQFVTSIGTHGKGEGELDCPYGISSDDKVSFM